MLHIKEESSCGNAHATNKEPRKTNIANTADSFTFPWQLKLHYLLLLLSENFLRPRAEKTVFLPLNRCLDDPVTAVKITNQHDGRPFFNVIYLNGNVGNLRASNGIDSKRKQRTN